MKRLNRRLVEAVSLVLCIVFGCFPSHFAPKLGGLPFRRPNRNAIAEAEPLFRHVGIPSNGVTIHHRVSREASQILDGQVEVFAAREVVRHFQHKGFAKRMVAETGERNIVVGVDAQFVSKRLRCVRFAVELETRGQFAEPAMAGLRYIGFP